MELGLSLGEAPAPAAARPQPQKGKVGLGLGFSIGFEEEEEVETGEEEGEEEEVEEEERGGSGEPPVVQLNLLPSAPVPRYPAGPLGFPWPLENRNLEASTRGFDVNRAPAAEDCEEAAAAAASTSPNSAVSSFHMDFSGSGLLAGAPAAGAGGGEPDRERASSRASDEEENGLARKKLRLSKDQSAFLEESFKEHNTLNPKQKLALAKQLNLRPRQVEVWFQNRRARTKLKQTEVDCEYLKRCCETLTEENRRLQKELSELRALKTSHPFYMHLPATTLSMCPSCERVSSSSSNPNSNAGASAAAAPTPADNARHSAGGGGGGGSAAKPASFAALFAKPRPFYPFGPHPAPAHQPSAAS